MAQESRLVIRVDSKLSEQQVKDLDKALNLLERTGLSVTRTAKTASDEITALGRGSDTATRSIDRATAVWSKLNSVVALAGVSLSAVAAINMYKSVAANVESLRLFSKQIGISTEQLSSLRYAADDMAGVSSRTLDPALRRMTRRIQEAANESGPAANALKMLRLEAKELSELDVESQLYAVANAMKELPNHADKLRATMAIFDTEGMPLVNMLNQGADAIKAAQIEAEKLNQTISQVDADRVGRLNSEFSKISAQLEGIKTQTAIGILPAVESLSTGLGVLAENFDTVAKVTGGVALVALSRYTGGLLETRAEIVKAALDKRAAARAELELAQAQKLQTAETLRQTLALNAQNVTRTQTQAAIQADIAARKRLTAAEANMTRQVTASTAAMGLARGALGLVGGPFGALTLAVTAGAGAWYGYQQRLEENKAKFQSMIVPVAQLREELVKLNQDQLELEQLEISPKIREFERQTQDLALAIQSIEKDYNALSESSAVTKEELENVEKTLIETRIEYRKSAEDLELLKLRQEEGAKILAKFKEAALSAGKGLAEFSTEAKGLSETDFTKLIDGFQQSFDVIGMSAQQAAEYKARLEGANNEQARLAGFWASLINTAQKLESATRDKDAAAIKGAQELLNKLAAQEVQLRMNKIYAAEYADLVAIGVSATAAASAAIWASELEGIQAQEEIVARIKTITENISANTVPTLKKTSGGVKQLSTQIDSLVDSLFPVLKAEKDWTNSQKLLGQALKKGRIDQTQYEKGIKLLREEYDKVAFVMPAHVKAIQDEAASIKSAIPGLRERVDTFGLSAAAIARNAESETRARIATLENIKAVEIAKGASAEYVKQIEDETKALKELLIYQEHQAGLTQDLAHREARQQALTDFADEAKRTHDEIERSLTDSLMRSFESGKGFAKSFLDSIKSLASTLILRPIVQPIAAGLAGAVTGALGFSGAANAGQAGGFGDLASIGGLFTNFSGSMAGAAQNIGSSLASMGGSFGDFGANIVMNADNIGKVLDGAGSVFAYGKSIYDLTQGKYGAAAGGAIGTAFGGPLGGMVGSTLGGLVDGMFGSGEKRGGGYYQLDQASQRAVRKGGASGEDGGQQTLDALTQMFGGTTSLIEDVFRATGVDASVAFYEGMFEDSKKNRGGVFSGGILDVGGEQVQFGTNKKGAGYGGKSGSLEEMFENLQKDLAFSTLEAWQAVSNQMPDVINQSLDGVDIRALSPEQAAAAVDQISGIVSSVTALTTALDALPFDNLAGLSFDLTASLLEAAGGMEHLIGGIGMYYQGFYSEAEQQARAAEMLTASVQELGYELPSTRDGFRALVESLDATDASSHAAIAGLFSLSGAADQFYAAAEQAAARLTEEQARLAEERSKVFDDQLRLAQDARAEQQRLQQEAYSAARSHVDQLMSAFKSLAQTQIKELEKAALATDKISNALQNALNVQVSSLQSVTSLLDDMVRELRGGAGLFEMQAAEGWRLIGNTLTTGIIPNADELRGAVNAIKGGFGDKAYDSIFERDRDQLVLANQLEQINAMAEPQLTIAEMQLQVMQDQLAELREGTKRAYELAGLSSAQIAAIRSVDEKTAQSVGLTSDQLAALQDGNTNSQVLQNLTRQQIQGILGVKDETASSTGLSREQLEALDKVDLSTSTIADLTRYMQTAMEAESIANKQIQTIQDQLATMQKQYDQLRGLNATMTTLDEGMRLLAKAMKAEEASKPNPGSGGTGSAPSKFGDKDYQLKNQTEARNYVLSNSGLLGAFATEVAAGWVSPSDYLKFAQFHYSNYGWNEGRDSGALKNLGRTHQPGSYSEAQAYLANNTDLLATYLSDAKTDASLIGDRGLLRFAQAHYDNYGRNEMPLRKYASGGDHMGGLRLVGELGPELEATGPSRIMSANKTQSILSKAIQGPDISGLINSLVRENQELRRMYEQSMKAMIQMQQRSTRVLERWEGDDYPVRVEEMPDESKKVRGVA